MELILTDIALPMLHHGFEGVEIFFLLRFVTRTVSDESSIASCQRAASTRVVLLVTHMLEQNYISEKQR